MGVAADRAERVVAAGAAGTLVAAAAGTAVVGAAVGRRAGAAGVASVPHAIPTKNRMNASKDRRLILPLNESGTIIFQHARQLGLTRVPMLTRTIEKAPFN